MHVAAVVNAALLAGVAVMRAWSLRSAPPGGAQREETTAGTADDTAPVGEDAPGAVKLR